MEIKDKLIETIEHSKKDVENGSFVFPELLVESDKGEKDMLVLGFLEEMSKRGMQLFFVGKKYRSENPGVRIKSVTLTSTVKARDRRKNETYEALMVAQKDVETGKSFYAMQKFVREGREKNKIKFVGEIDYSEEIQTGMIDAFIDGFND